MYDKTDGGSSWRAVNLTAHPFVSVLRNGLRRLASDAPPREDAPGHCCFLLQDLGTSDCYAPGVAYPPRDVSARGNGLEPALRDPYVERPTNLVSPGSSPPLVYVAEQDGIVYAVENRRGTEEAELFVDLSARFDIWDAQPRASSNSLSIPASPRTKRLNSLPTSNAIL